MGSVGAAGHAPVDTVIFARGTEADPVARIKGSGYHHAQVRRERLLLKIYAETGKIEKHSRWGLKLVI